MEPRDLTSTGKSADRPSSSYIGSEDVIRIKTRFGRTITIPMDQSEVLQKHLAAFNVRLEKLTPHIPVTTALVLLNFAIYALMAYFSSHGWARLDIDELVDWGANFGPLLYYGQWWRIFASMFIHLNIVHLAFNMLFLYLAGCTVERMVGPAHFLLLYLFSGITGNMLSLFWDPVMVSAGASGAIFGVYGSLLAFLLREGKWLARDVLKAMRGNAVGFIVANLWFGLVHPGVANSAHIGGLLGGIGIGYLLARPLDITKRAQDGDQRLLVPFLVSMAVIGLLSYPLSARMHHIDVEVRFVTARYLWAQQEKELLKSAMALDERRNSHEIRDPDYANELRITIIPELTTMKEMVAAPHLGPLSKGYELQHVLLRYLEHRIEEAQANADAIQKGNPALFERAREEKNYAAADLNEFHRLSALAQRIPSR
jgi:rhomboid protease GluP